MPHENLPFSAVLATCGIRRPALAYENPPDEDPEKEKKYLQLLESKQADGFIIAVTARSHEYLQSLPIQHLALISIDRSLFDLGIDTVMVDNRAGARTAMMEPWLSARYNA